MKYFSMTALCFNEWMKMLTFGFPFCNFDLKMWNSAIKIIRSNTVSLNILDKAKQNQSQIQFHLYVPTDQCTDIRPERLDSLTLPKPWCYTWLSLDHENFTSPIWYAQSILNSAALVPSVMFWPQMQQTLLSLPLFFHALTTAILSCLAVLSNS